MSREDRRKAQIEKQRIAEQAKLSTAGDSADTIQEPISIPPTPRMLGLVPVAGEDTAHLGVGSRPNPDGNRSVDPSRKPIDRWLGIGGIVAAILLFLLAKTPPIVIGLLIVMFALLAHPVWNFWWIESAAWRRIFSLALLAVGLAFLGRYVWPMSEPTIKTDTTTPTAKEIAKELAKLLSKQYSNAADTKDRIDRAPMLSSVTPHETENILDVLRSSALPHALIRIGCAARSEADCVFAGLFLDLFRIAGWKVVGNRVERLELDKPVAGVIIFGRGVGTADPDNPLSGLRRQSDNAQTVETTFESISIATAQAADAAMPDGVIGVYFGLGSSFKNLSASIIKERAEIRRKYKIMKDLVLEYRATHKVTITDQVPNEWLNKRLKEMGEIWSTRPQ